MNEPLAEPREMRKHLLEVARGGVRVDGEFTPRAGWTHSAALVRQCQELSWHLGFSGEDAMTLLAYHALLRMEALADAESNRLLTSPMPPMILTVEDTPK